MASGRAGFTTRASCLIAAGVTALACGVLLGIVDLARAGVLAIAVPLLSALVVLRSRVQIANRRSAEPARAVAGDTVVVHLTISNRSLLPTGSLMLEDQLPGQLRGNARFAIDGDIGNFVFGQHVADELPDAAVADDERGGIVAAGRHGGDGRVNGGGRRVATREPAAEQGKRGNQDHRQ